VGQTDLYGPDETGLGLEHGDTYHPEGVVAIAPTKDPRKLPKPTFFAKVMSGNPDLDIAVIRVFGMIDQNADLPDALPMAVMTLDDSDKVELGDSVYVFGYPGAGGELLTYTEGKISGFEDQNTEDEIENDSFKTDAAINPGNSGGLAVDAAGNQIGIPTFTSNRGVGIGGLRQINLVVPYINQALKLGGSDPITGTTPITSTTPVTTTTPTETPIPNTPFGAITFGTGVAGGKLTGVGTEFETGTAAVIGAFPYQGMRNGTKWGWIWNFNGKDVLDSRTTETWDEGARGMTGVRISNADGLPDGRYALKLYVNNALAQQGTFAVGDASGTPTPTPPDPPDEGVTLKGRIVDVDTEEGVAGGVFVVLKPGTSLEEFDNSKGDELVAAIGVADEDGYYLTAPGLDRGETYTVIVAGRGYNRRVFEDALELTDEDPPLIEIDDIALEQR
jgi:hypothetical protein